MVMESGGWIYYIPEYDWDAVVLNLISIIICMLKTVLIVHVAESSRLLHIIFLTAIDFKI